MCIHLESLAARAIAFLEANPRLDVRLGEAMICVALIEKARPKREEKKSEPVPDWLLAQLREPHTYVSIPSLLQRAGRDALSQRAVRAVRAWLLQLGYEPLKRDGRSVYARPA